MTIRIVLLDDHTILRRGLSLYLAQQPGFQIVGECGTSRELLQLLLTAQPDLLLIDYSLGEESADGLALIRMLHVRHPQAKILMLSAHSSPATVTTTLRAGAHGFVAKTQNLEDVPQAIREVMAGRSYIPREAVQELVVNRRMIVETARPHDSNVRLDDHFTLSPKEREVLRCCLDGMTVTQIAKKFSRSVKTISGQKQNAFRKLGISSDNELFKINHLL